MVDCPFSAFRSTAAQTAPVCVSPSALCSYIESALRWAERAEQRPSFSPRSLSLFRSRSLWIPVLSHTHSHTHTRTHTHTHTLSLWFDWCGVMRSVRAMRFSSFVVRLFVYGPSLSLPISLPSRRPSPASLQYIHTHTSHTHTHPHTQHTHICVLSLSVQSGGQALMRLAAPRG